MLSLFRWISSELINIQKQFEPLIVNNKILGRRLKTYTHVNNSLIQCSYNLIRSMVQTEYLFQVNSLLNFNKNKICYVQIAD